MLYYVKCYWKCDCFFRAREFTGNFHPIQQLLPILSLVWKSWGQNVYEMWWNPPFTIFSQQLRHQTTWPCMFEAIFQWLTHTLFHKHLNYKFELFFLYKISIDPLKDSSKRNNPIKQFHSIKKCSLDIYRSISAKSKRKTRITLLYFLWPFSKGERESK